MKTMRVATLAVICTTVLAGAALAQDEPLGKKVYARKCEGCHGADGKGNAKMAQMLKITIPALAGARTRTDAELLKIISEGKKPMPAFGTSLSKEELEAVMHYAKGLATGAVAGGK